MYDFTKYPIKKKTYSGANYIKNGSIIEHGTFNDLINNK